MNSLKSLALSAAATLAISCTPREKQIEQPIAPEISLPAQATESAAREVIPQLLPTVKAEEQEAPNLNTDPTPTKLDACEPIREPAFDKLSKRETAQVSEEIEHTLKIALKAVLGEKCKHPFFKTTPIQEEVEPVTMLFRNKKGSHVITNDKAVCGIDSGIVACGMIFNQHDGKENPDSGFIVHSTCMPVKPQKNAMKKLDSIGLKPHPDLSPVINKGNLRRMEEMI